MSDSPAADSPLPPKRNPFGLLFLIVLADMLGFGIIIPMLPFYARKFEASNFAVTMLLSVYSFCQFVAAPILGSLSDRIGRRPVLIFSQLGSASASIVLGIATAIHFDSAALGLGIIYLSRIVDGISGGNISAAQAYVSDVTTPDQRAKYMGLLGAAFGIGFALGPGIGGVLGHFNPAFPPFAAAAFSLTAAVLAYFRLPESLTHRAPHQPGWHITRSARLMRYPVLAQLVLVWFLSMFAFVTMESVFAIFLNDRFGFGELGVGLTFMLAGVMIILVQGKLIGPLKSWLGEWNLAIIGPLLFAVAMLLYARTSVTPLVAILVVAVMFNALGRSLQTPTLSSLVSTAAPPGGQGAAFGLFHGMGSLSRVFGPALAGLMYDRQIMSPFMLAAALTVIAGLWMIGIRAQTRPATTLAPEAA
ncbi:MAG: MFS transporter [Burkholderiales bacterium]|nr:MFS transporter [Phycisphaerae bacterium]